MSKLCLEDISFSDNSAQLLRFVCVCIFEYLNMCKYMYECGGVCTKVALWERRVCERQTEFRRRKILKWENMQICSSTTRLLWMLLLSHTIDLTINHAVMSVTPLQIHANEAMIGKGFLLKIQSRELTAQESGSYISSTCFANACKAVVLSERLKWDQGRARSLGSQHLCGGPVWCALQSRNTRSLCWLLD